VTTFLVGLPLLALAAVLEATVFTRWPLAGGRIDLVLLLTLSWTLIGEWQGGAIWGLIGGLFLDLLSGGPLGANALGLVLVAYLASLSEGRFWRSHVLLPLATALLASLVYHLVYLFALASTGHAVSWLASLGTVTLPTVLINTLAMLPVYHLLRWLYNVVHPTPVTIEP
jgi:rod shape-determining protein MreD